MSAVNSMESKMLWKFKDITRVYVFHARAPFDQWESIVDYDLSGNPCVRDSDPRCTVRREIYADGSSEGSCGWKFKSGPPIGFNREGQLSI